MAENPRESDVINGVHGKLIYNGTWPTDLPEDKPLELRLKMLRLDVDVSDALTGLKALRREADRAVAALKALEEALRTRNFRRDEYVLWEGELHRVICADEETAVLAPSRHYPEEGRTNTDYTKLFAVSNRPELYETIADRVARVDDEIAMNMTWLDADDGLPLRPEVSE